jgi:hypothetical protein
MGPVRLVLSLFSGIGQRGGFADIRRDFPSGSGGNRTSSGKQLSGAQDQSEQNSQENMVACDLHAALPRVRHFKTV